MAKKISGPQILTANLLSDGLVVFLGKGGSWSASLEGAQLAHSDTDVARLEAMGGDAARANHIVDPYLVEVEETGPTLSPIEMRERMRARGPSVNLEFNSKINGHALVAEQAVAV
jgi:sulfite reductase (NADPH) hemoprotein beta-component